MSRHCRSKNTCWDERICFAYLWHCGFSIKTIANVSGRSPTTIRKWVRNLLEASLHRSYHTTLTPTAPPSFVMPNVAGLFHTLPYPYENPCTCKNTFNAKFTENTLTDFQSPICIAYKEVR